MSALSPEFLTQTAREYKLTPTQEKTFVERFISDRSEIEVANILNVTRSALRSRMTVIYRKFDVIDDNGPGKFNELKLLLLKQQQIWLNPKSLQPEVDSPVDMDSPVGLDIEELVKSCRKKVKGLIQEWCGTMRVLDMEQPIELGDIYINVNILENLTGQRRLAMADLLQDFNPEDFDRIGLPPVTEARVPGLEAVQRYQKLMILGKPGAGKTTFLKNLAIQCCAGAFQANCVPIFITLKNFSEARNQPELLKFIPWLLRNVSESHLEKILDAGRVLLLLDGLDEVRKEDASRVLQDIQAVVDRYPKNKFLITCRIAAKEYTFENFTEVEVADFDMQQIYNFATKWFRFKQPARAEKFTNRLNQNKRIQELATNPLLLTLLCLIFEGKGNFKDSRAELYEEGIELLLEKWDGTRDIERNPIYKKLPTKRKEDLLSHIGFTTFDKSEYIFKRRTLEPLIADYIQNLPEVQTDPDALLISSRKVLRSLEAQHGILVERAKHIYSFSHLTFQEYFTARNIISSRTSLEQSLQGLVLHMTERRWREVFLLTAEMLPAADYLLELMKEQIDSLLAGDDQLQQFLAWVGEKAVSIEVTYKPAAVRAFYLAQAFDRALARALALDRALALNLALDRALALALTIDRSLDLDLDLALDLALNLAYALDRGTLLRALVHSRSLARALALDHTLDLDLALALALALARALVLSLNRSARALSLSLALDLAIERALVNASDRVLHRKLNLLKEQLLKENNDFETFKQWWETNGSAWVENLRTIIVEHRNIGHDWHFNVDQLRKLDQYYDANKLLVDCLNSDCYVTRSVRERIEATLLLPVSA